LSKNDPKIFKKKGTFTARDFSEYPGPLTPSRRTSRLVEATWGKREEREGRTRGEREGEKVLFGKKKMSMVSTHEASTA
jgi:hypothetical protein